MSKLRGGEITIKLPKNQTTTKVKMFQSRTWDKVSQEYQGVDIGLPLRVIVLSFNSGVDRITKFHYSISNKLPWVCFPVETGASLLLSKA